MFLKDFKWFNAADDNNAIDTNKAFDDFLGGIDTTQVNPPVETDNSVSGNSTAETSSDTDATAQTGNDAGAADDAAQNNDDAGIKFDSKRAQDAFARMRIATREQTNLLERVLQRFNIDPKLARTPDALKQLLDEADNQQAAEEMKVPVELLNRLQHLEDVNRKAEADKLYQTALLGFSNLQNELRLSKDEMKTFAQQLMQDGVDPFTTQVNLKNEYIVRNYKTLIDKAVNEAVKEALDTNSKAQQHSTTPAAKHGVTIAQTDAEKIDTQSKFDKLLASI